MFYMLNFSSFFVHLYKHKKGRFFLCISLCMHKKEKSVYVKLYTANPANVMCAYVYIRILKKCSGWFRYTDFRKFCAGLFAYFSLREAAALRAKCICLYVQKRKQNVYVYIHKKKNKMHMFTYTKFEAICIALRIHKKKAAGSLPPAAGTPAAGTPPAGLHMFTCIHFFSPHTINTQTPAGSTSGQKIKKCIHYIYIPFLCSKSAYTIYTPETTLPAGSSHSNGSTTTLPPRKLAGSRQKYDKSPPATTALPLKRIPTFCRQQN